MSQQEAPGESSPPAQDPLLSILSRIPLSENPLTKLWRDVSNNAKKRDAISFFAGLSAFSLTPDEREAYFAPISFIVDSVPCTTVSSFISLGWLSSSSSADDLEQQQQRKRGVSEAVATLAHLRCEVESIKREPFSDKAAPQPQQSYSSTAHQKQWKNDRDNHEQKSTATVNQPPEQKQQQRRQRKILVSFNGGKDCMVILHLMCSAFTVAELCEHFVYFVHEEKEEKEEKSGALAAISVAESATTKISGSGKDEFAEVTAFRDWIMSEIGESASSSSSTSKLDFRICRGSSLRDHLWRLVTEFAVESVLIGTRATDPSGKWQKGCLSPTTSSWPPVVLVAPVFYWSYRMVWEYTLNLDVPRCVLYDRGYTSLGHKCVTTPNEALKQSSSTFKKNKKSDKNDDDDDDDDEAKKNSGGGVDDDDDDVATVESFAPAWRLLDENLERSNRVSCKVNPSSNHCIADEQKKSSTAVQLASSI